MHASVLLCERVIYEMCVLYKYLSSDSNNFPLVSIRYYVLAGSDEVVDSRDQSVACRARLDHPLLD
jgi:hypothetical protein